VKASRKGIAAPVIDPDELRGFQRKYLRGLAHALKPVVRVGKAGISDEVLRKVDVALDDHELIKVSMHKPKDKKKMAAALAEGCKAELAGLLGHTVILYRQHKEKPRIRLPQRDVAEAPEAATE
jgi:RNA-binding protein